jgi:hypothetical protein
MNYHCQGFKLLILTHLLYDKNNMIIEPLDPTVKPEELPPRPPHPNPYQAMPQPVTQPLQMSQPTMAEFDQPIGQNFIPPITPPPLAPYVPPTPVIVPTIPNKGWRTFFILLVVFNGLLIVLPIIAIIISFIFQGSIGFVIAFAVVLGFFYLMWAWAVLALINIISISIYLTKHRPRKRMIVLDVIVIIISALCIINAVQWYYATKDLSTTHTSQLKQSIQDKQSELTKVRPRAITVEEATSLLTSCQLRGFYYTGQTKSSDLTYEQGAENVETGIELTYISGEPYRIAIADRLINQMVPVAESAQKTCLNLQIWHDGSYQN